MRVLLIALLAAISYAQTEDICAGLDCMPCLDETNFACTYYMGTCISAETAPMDGLQSDFVFDSQKCPTDMAPMDPTMDPVERYGDEVKALDPTVDPTMTDTFTVTGDATDPTVDPTEFVDTFEGGDSLDPTIDPTMRETDFGEELDRQFYMGRPGTECPESDLVMTGEDCENAAKMIDVDYVPTIPFDLWEAPFGCVAAQTEMENVEIYFNTNANGGANMKVAPVCKRSDPTVEAQDPTMDPSEMFDMVESQDPTMDPSEMFGMVESQDPTMDPSEMFDIVKDMDPTMDPSEMTDMFESMDPTMDPVERIVECTVEVAATNMNCPTAKCFTPSMEEQNACDGVIELAKEIDEESDECCLKLCNYECMSVDKMVKFEVALKGADAVRRNEDKVKESLKNAVSSTYGADKGMITVAIDVAMRRLMQAGDSVMVGVEIGPYTESEATRMTDVVNTTPPTELNTAFESEAATSELEGVSVLAVNEAFFAESESDMTTTNMPEVDCSGMDCVTCLDGEETNFMCTYYQGECILAATADRDAVMSDFVWDSSNCPTDVGEEGTMDPTMDPSGITDTEGMDPTMDPVERMDETTTDMADESTTDMADETTTDMVDETTTTDMVDETTTDMPEESLTFMPKQLVFYSDSSCSNAVTANLALGNTDVHLLGGECQLDLSGQPISYICKESGIIEATFYTDLDCANMMQTVTLANGVCSYIERNDFYAIMAWEGDCGGVEIDECPATECEAPVCEEIKYCSCESGMTPVAIMDDEGCPACACTDVSSQSHYYGEAGSVCDPWQMVESEQECEAAAAVLGANFIPSLRFEDWTSPYGCIGDLRDGGEVMFNANPNGSPSEVRRPVCSTDSYDAETCRVVCEEEPLTTMDIYREPSVDPTMDPTQEPTELEIVECDPFGDGCTSCVPRQNGPGNTWHCATCREGFELYFDEMFGYMHCREAGPCPGEPTSMPSEYPTASLYLFVEYDTKCPMSASRTFKLDYTSEQNCALRCETDENCEFFSIGWGLCIGCSVLPSSIGGVGILFDTYMVNSGTALPTKMPTMAPTDPYQMVSMDTKCQMASRTFKLDFTSLDNCARRCQDDLNCQYVSTDMASWCIGCMEEPTDYHGGAQTYYVNPTEDCSAYEGDNYVQCLETLVEHLQESC